MLILPIKQKWFDMIWSGDKEEEYREIKPYYTKRFQTIGLLDGEGNPTNEMVTVMFRNGYGKNRPECVAVVRLRVGKGLEEWGAEPGVEYYVLEIVMTGG